MHEGGSSAQNSSAWISTAQHFFWKCQLLNRKIVIACIRLIPLFEMYGNKWFLRNVNFMLGLCRSRISCWRCCRDDWNSHFRLRSRDWGYFRIFRDWFNRTKSCQTFNSSKSNQRNGGWFENKQVSKFKFKPCSLLSKKLTIKN